MRQIPLSGRVVFVDWHGVLSRDPFWVSIRQSATHPLRDQLEANLADIFSRENTTANEWMKGLLSSEQVIAAMDISLDRRFRDDFLARRLYIDCARMTVNVELVEVLRNIKATALVVVATDNMDCFATTFSRIRSRGRRHRRGRSTTLVDWALICDDIICSSDVAALKSEDPVGFFHPWLTQYGLSFTDAVLIDDRADNCAAFQQQGGATLRWKMGTSNINEVIDGLNQWLETPAPV